MTRQIKRTRQIEDFVIEKLARRGFITDKDKENPAQFVKGQQSTETISQLMVRRAQAREQVLINEATVFSVELALEEFRRLCALDFAGAPWFEDIKQIVQIHFCYKSLAFNGSLEQIREMIEITTRDAKADHIKAELAQFIGEQCETVDMEKFRKFINSKNHCVYKQQKHEVVASEVEIERLLSYVSKFPLTFNVLAGAVEVSSLFIEEENQKNNNTISTEHIHHHPPPLTPPETEEPSPEIKLENEILMATMKSAFRAVSGVPISPTRVWLNKLSLPHDIRACSAVVNDRNQTLMAVGRSDNLVTVISAKPNHVKHVDLIAHSRPVWTVAWDTHGDFLYSGGADRDIHVWDVGEFQRKGEVKLATSYHGHSFGVTNIDVSQYYFASSSVDRSARLWSLQSSQYLRLFAGHEETVNCVRFHPNSNYVFTGSDDRSIRLWDIMTGKCQRTYFMTNSGAYKCAVKSIDISPDGKRIAGSYDDGVIRIFDIAESKLEGEYFTNCKTNNEVEMIRYNSNGSLLGSISSDTVRVWADSCETVMLRPKLAKTQALCSLSWRGVSSLTVTAQ